MQFYVTENFERKDLNQSYLMYIIHTYIKTIYNMNLFIFKTIWDIKLSTRDALFQIKLLFKVPVNSHSMWFSFLTVWSTINVILQHNCSSQIKVVNVLAVSSHSKLFSVPTWSSNSKGFCNLTVSFIVDKRHNC